MEIPVYALLFLFLAPTALAVVLAHVLKTLRTVTERQRDLDVALDALREGVKYQIEAQVRPLTQRLQANEDEAALLHSMFLRQSERLGDLRSAPSSRRMMPAGRTGSPETLVQPVPATAYERLLND